MTPAMTVATWLRRLIHPQHPMHAQQPPVQQSTIVIESTPISQSALDAVAEMALQGWPYSTPQAQLRRHAVNTATDPADTWVVFTCDACGAVVVDPADDCACGQGRSENWTQRVLVENWRLEDIRKAMFAWKDIATHRAPLPTDDTIVGD